MLRKADLLRVVWRLDHCELSDAALYLRQLPRAVVGLTPKGLAHKGAHDGHHPRQRLSQRRLGHRRPGQPGRGVSD